MANRSHIALLFFSRDAFAESIHKPIFGKSEHKKNLEIAQLMIGQTRQVLDKTGLDVIHFTQKDQQGNSFGERLANAYQSVFDLGYDAVIAIGNDTPEIATICWDTLINDMQNGHSVVGPTQRGGAYLIGIQQQNFDKEAFAQLAWQGKSLFTDLFSQLSENAIVTQLVPLQELNKSVDLAWFINGTDKKWQFVQLLFRLLQQKNWAVLSLVFVLSCNGYLTAHQLRGPPNGTSHLKSFVEVLCRIICAFTQHRYFSLRFFVVKTHFAKHILFRGPPLRLMLPIA